MGVYSSSSWAWSARTSLYHIQLGGKKGKGWDHIFILRSPTEPKQHS